MHNKIKLFIILFIIIAVSGCINKNVNDIEYSSNKEHKMNLSSDNFQNNEILPAVYTCSGDGKSPELNWSGFPNDTKSFALTLEDPDAPNGTFIHWIIANIPINIKSLPEGAQSLTDATMITNDEGKSDYYPPCPPSGTHRYIFKIFALSSEKIDAITKENFYDKINPLTIDSAILETTYGK